MSKHRSDRSARVIRDRNVREAAREAREYTYQDPYSGEMRFVRQDVIIHTDKDGWAISYSIP